MSPSPAARPRPFVWHTIDVRPMLPRGWEEEIDVVARQHAIRHELIPGSVTSREGEAVEAVPVMTVGGEAVAEALPWLHTLYHSRFRRLASAIFGKPVETVEDTRYGIYLNVQQGTEMRYEAHVDSAPISGLLYASTHAPGSGGELVIANHGDVKGVDEIERDCSRVYPVAGYFVLFDARFNSHYVAPLRDPDSRRIAAAMSFYTTTSRETDRPDDLMPHLGLDQPTHTKEHRV